MAQTVSVMKSHKCEYFIDSAHAIDCVEEILSYMVGHSEVIRILHICPQFVSEKSKCLGKNLRSGENLGICRIDSSYSFTLREKRILSGISNS